MTHALSVAVQVRKRQKEEIKDSTNFHPLFFLLLLLLLSKCPRRKELIGYKTGQLVEKKKKKL